MENNWDMIGHQWAVSMLQGQIKNKSFRHAYLITGPKGIGKRTLALKMATQLNSLVDATQESDSRYLQQMERMEHADLSVVKRLPGDKNIKIDAVRSLQKNIYLTPYLSPHRIALILDFEDANPNAANALLKTLEEPPKSTILFLTASNTESLLPTIVSRCEVIRLRPVPLEIVAEGLVNRWGISAAEAKLLAHISGGRVGYALHLYQNPEMMEQRKLLLDQHISLLSQGKVERFQFAQKISKDRETLLLMLNLWLSIWRDILVISINQASAILNLDRDKEIIYLANQFSTKVAHQAVMEIEKMLNQLRFNINLRLATEVMLIGLPSIKM